MGYDGKINRKLRTVELNDDDECLYKLAYRDDKKSSFKRIDILNYVNKHYLEKDNIIEENLLNDLNTFKTYRDDVEITEKNWDIFQGLITIYVALFNDVFKSETAVFTRLCYISLILAVSILVYLIRTCKHSNYYKLKFVTNAIYTLETIKEDKYRNGIWCKKSDERYEGLELTEVKEIRTYTYKATQNKYSPRAMYERRRH